MPDIAVFIVHGMGTQDADFWKPLAGELDDRLAALGVAPGAVAWRGGYWADLLNGEEEQVWQRELAGGRLDFKLLRRFVVTALGDAIAYRRGEAGEESVYDAIHARILAELRQLRTDVGADLPLVVMAHSLGCVIMSDFVWNAQTNNAWARGQRPLECMHTLAGLITFGSSLPLFSIALPEIEAIVFPPPELPAHLAAVAEWRNYYDKDDILGWPLKTLSPSYDRAVTADHAINVGSFLASWNPASHTGYWTDRDFIGPAAAQLHRVITAVRGAPTR